MTGRWHRPLLPAYLGLCLLLGGSTEGVWTNLALQLGAIPLIALSLATVGGDQTPRRARHLLAIAFGAIAIVVLQLVPLPPSVWASLPGRGFVAHGFTLLGEPLPWLPLSLTPVQTIVSGCFLLPPLAVILWIIRGGALSLRATVAVLLVVGVAGAALGLRQIATGDLNLYFYAFSNWGKAPGFFANSAHMAILMLASVPFLAALAIDLNDGGRKGGKGTALAFGGTAILLVLLALIAVNSSGAVLALTAPVLFLSVALWGGRGVAWLRRLAFPIGLVAITGAVALTYLSGRSQASNQTSFDTRSVIWTHSREALDKFGLAGSGVGSFAEIYRRFEPPATIDLTYVNHAHNDFLELALETGLPGIVLIALFLLWWGRAAWTAWRGPYENAYARAATIASGAILIHEMVEFPLRSPAIAALFAMCVGLMAMVSTLSGKRLDGDLWTSRHLVVD